MAEPIRLQQPAVNDAEQLRALVDQAWELRGTPYIKDACEAIADWHDRRHLRQLEEEQERAAALARLLRQTTQAA